MSIELARHELHIIGLCIAEIYRPLGAVAIAKSLHLDPITSLMKRLLPFKRVAAILDGTPRHGCFRPSFGDESNVARGDWLPVVGYIPRDAHFEITFT